MEDIKTIHEVNPALAYLQGMLWAAFGVKVISTDAHEWQIDAMKEYDSQDRVDRYLSLRSQSIIASIGEIDGNQ